MDLCPHCQTPVSLDKVTDGKCPICGMALSVEGETTGFDSKVVDIPVGAHTLQPGVMTPAELPTMQLPEKPPTADDDTVSPRGIELIRPRKLSPQYERQVTAAWQNTISQIREPGETIRPEDDKENGTKISPERVRADRAGAETTILDSSPGELDELYIGLRVLGKAGDSGPKDYELRDEKLGEGGMGVVWSARQLSLNRDVAIKTPKRQEAGTVAGRRRFASEVVITGQLDHPNIVPIYDLGKDSSGELFYAMKQVIGRQWSDVLDNKEKTLQENLEILMKVCDAIRFAHDRGVIHRDIKPENVMIGQYGEVSVMDWGIALRLDFSNSGLAPAQSGGGTPQYMAPEMATGSIASIGPATDVYLLGAVLYEILTDYPPHPAPAPSDNLRKRINEALLIAARNVIEPIEAGGELADIAYKALATDMENRYQNVKEFQDAVREYHSHVESINLTERGEKLLVSAQKNGHGHGADRFDDFDRARFAFEEALQIWPSNRVARTRHAEALMAYAQYAYDEGAYARGIALLKEDNADHKDLLRKLKAARRRTNSLWMMLQAAAVLIIVGGGAFSYYLYRANEATDAQRIVAEKNAADAEAQRIIADQNAKKAEDNAKIALDNAKKAEDNAKVAGEQKILAEQNAQKAEDNALEAGKQRDLAKTNAQVAQENEVKAQIASYVFEIGLAAEELQRNAFDRATEILESQAASATKSPLRNWEWGYLKKLVSLEPSSFNTNGKLVEGRVETTAVSKSSDKSKSWVAAGTNEGLVYVWRLDRSEQPVQLRYGTAVSSVAITPDGSMLLAAGRSNGGKNTVKAWKLPADDNAKPDAEFGEFDSQILSLELSQDSSTALVGTADRMVGLVKLDGSNKTTQFEASSQVNSSVWSARFSPDDKWIVTAGNDGKVRIWEIENNGGSSTSVREVLRYEENDGPVYAATFSPDGRSVVFGGQDRRLLAVRFNPEEAATMTYKPADNVENRLSGKSEIAKQSDAILLGTHEAPVRSLAFAPDGKVLFSAGHDHTVRVWDTEQGIDQVKSLKTLRGHGGWVRSCAAMPDDSDQVLSGGYDRRVRIWNWRKYSFPLVLDQESERGMGDSKLTAGAASPNGEWVASGSESGVLTLWDMSNPLEPKPFELAEGHDWQATTGIYFADGQRLLTAGGDNTALVWDVDRGNEILRIGGRDAKEGAGWRGVASVSDDGRLIATGAEGNVLARIWDANSGEPLASIEAPSDNTRSAGEKREATALSFSPDGQKLVIGDQWGTCYLATAETGWQVRPLQVHERKISAVKFLPDGQGFLTASYDGKVIEWTADGAPRETYAHDDRVVAMDLSVDGRTMITAAGSNDKQAVLRIWDRSLKDKPIRLLGLSAIDGSRAASVKSSTVRSVTLHPTEPRALVTIFDPENTELPYRIGEWKWQSETSPYRLVSGGAQRDLSTVLFAPARQGEAILTVGGRGARLRGLNSLLSLVSMSYRPQSVIRSMSFSADGNKLVSASQDGSLKVWSLDADTRQWLPDAKVVSQQRTPINAVAFHPSLNDEFLTADDGGMTKLWKMRDGNWEVTATLSVPGAQANQVFSTAFVPNPENADHLQIVSAGTAGAFLWDGPDDKTPQAIGPASVARCVVPSPKGEWLVVATGSKAQVFDAKTLAPVSGQLTGHSADITAIAFTPDGSRLFTTSDDYTVKLWDPKSSGQQRELLTLEGHTREVTSVNAAGSKENPLVVTTGLDGQTIVWPNEPLVH